MRAVDCSDRPKHGNGDRIAAQQQGWHVPCSSLIAKTHLAADETGATSELVHQDATKLPVAEKIRSSME
jgi:hypothetical protein